MRHDPDSEPDCCPVGSLERPPAFDCPVLLTETLVLRAPHAEDIDAIAILADNPAIATMVSRIPHPYGRGDAETFWIGEPFWRRGIATQAVHALVDMAFRTREIDHIDARCRVINPASRRVLQKSGFQFQGSGMINILSINASAAVEWFRLDRKTWISLIGWSKDNKLAAL